MQINNYKLTNFSIFYWILIKKGSADPFCEVLLNNMLIGKTKVCKDSLAPIWEEDISVPQFTSAKDVITIECYDMNTLGKGNLITWYICFTFKF